MVFSFLHNKVGLSFLVLLALALFLPLFASAQTSTAGKTNVVQFITPSQEMTIKVGEPLLIQYKTLEGADIGEVRHSVSGEFGSGSFAAFLGKPGMNSFSWTPTAPGRYQVAVSMYQRQIHTTQWSSYITVVAGDTAPIIDFSTSQVLFTKKGAKGALKWEVKNATGCVLITGFEKKKKVSLKGTQKIKPRDNTRYTLECVNGDESGDGTRTSRKTIEVSVSPSTARLIDSFTMTNFSGIPNTTALFSWKASKASACGLYRVSDGGTLSGHVGTSTLLPIGSITSLVSPATSSSYPAQYALMCESYTGTGDQMRRFQDTRLLPIRFAK